ncbi:MAG: M3 family metallopeptidase [Oceanipulchritudo sp.]
MDWDLTSYFEQFGTPAYTSFKEDLTVSMKGLDEQARDLLEQPAVSGWETLLCDYESVMERYSHLASYISCLTAADARNEAYLKEETALAELQALVSKVMDKLIRGLGLLTEEAFQELLDRERLEEAGFRLREWRRESKNRMAAELEDLAADLGINGISAWSRLYFTTMGNLKFHYTDPESGPTEVPMSQLNSLLAGPDRARRIAAAEGAARTFEEHQHFYAGALNAISGTRHVLNKRRAVDDFLEPSLRQSHIRQETLRALMTAIEDRLPFAREVFRFRSERLGINDPGWVDLRAPLPLGETGGPAWNEGVRLISGAFNAVYPDLGSFFDELVGKQWIDHTPRPGKRPGGFCTGSLMTRESRIFMTYKDTLNDVLTLAHEAGHAWHSRILAGRRVLASHYPMTLAETASTLAERMLTEGVMRDSRVEDVTKLIILDAEIEHMLAFLLDLPIRFRFEEAVYERRRTGTLSPGDLCGLMRDTQRAVFGEVMTEGREDPWFWASKMHFYINQVQFYNYPYTFGYLLSTAYMEHFRETGAEGLKTYERFLAGSGQYPCEELVRETLGEDIADPAFWTRMIDGLERPFSQYRELLGKKDV